MSPQTNTTSSYYRYDVERKFPHGGTEHVRDLPVAVARPITLAEARAHAAAATKHGAAVNVALITADAYRELVKAEGRTSPQRKAATNLDLTTRPHQDSGLPGEFIAAVVDALREHDVEAHHEFPGMLTFNARGRWWATAHTGLHVEDLDGEGIEFDGDEQLVEFETRSELSVREYVETLLALIAQSTNDVAGEGLNHAGL